MPPCWHASARSARIRAAAQQKPPLPLRQLPRRSAQNRPLLWRPFRLDGKVVVLTGAGVSAESGVPTFRDAQTGLWANFKPEELATPQAFLRNPKLVWDWYAARRAKLKSVQPNAGHFALAELERHVPDFMIVTQNVDGLHQRAGSRNVIELHGNITRVRCFDEGTVIADWKDPGESPPRCPECHAYLRPDVVWFNEPLPESSFEAAEAKARACDVFLSIGTSSIVYNSDVISGLMGEGGFTKFVGVPGGWTDRYSY